MDTTTALVNIACIVVVQIAAWKVTKAITTRISRFRTIIAASEDTTTLASEFADI